LSHATRSAFTIIVHQSFVLSRYGQVRWQDCWVDIEDPYHIVVQGKLELVSALLHWESVRPSQIPSIIGLCLIVCMLLCRHTMPETLKGVKATLQGTRMRSNGA